MIRRITTASLVSTDGTITHYGIYEANLHFNLSGQPFIDLNHNTRFVTTITKDRRKDGRWANDELAHRYLEMARPYGTANAPAFTFTDCVLCYGTDPDCHCKSRNPNLTSSSSSIPGENQNVCASI